MKELNQRAIKMVGTSDQAKITIFESDLKGPLALVVGAEGTGIRRLTADNCDVLINIPMGGTVECLNVSVATGVCLFEAFRQRRS
jgi:23S rRNA (guanosine2251-2'-O)-methyltransferase